MAYVAPSTRSAGALITAAIWNQDVVANPIALYAGAMSLSGQNANDFIYASSNTQLGRLAASVAKVPYFRSVAWELAQAMMGDGSALVRGTAVLSAGNNNNLASAGYGLLAVNASAGGCVITGLADGSDGRVVWIVPTGGNLTLSGEDGSSSAANRFFNSSGTIGAGQVVRAIYIGSSSRWAF